MGRLLRLAGVGVTILSFFMPGGSQETDLPSFKGGYFGQALPGETPEPFKPELFSTQGRFAYYLHSSLFFTPDGRRVYFTNQSLPVNVGYDQTILFMENEDGTWKSPQIAPFSGEYSDQVFMISADGNRIYFTSTRPLSGNDKAVETRHMWQVEKKDSEWLAPRHVASPIDLRNDEGDFYVSADLPGGLGKTDIYRLHYQDTHYSMPENIGRPVNTEFEDEICCIPRDGSYIIYYHFSQEHKSSIGLYLSFHQGNTAWSDPIHLSKKWNLSFGFAATLSPDEKVLFLLDRGDGIYWVNAQAIEKFRED